MPTAGIAAQSEARRLAEALQKAGAGQRAAGPRRARQSTASGARSPSPLVTNVTQFLAAEILSVVLRKHPTSCFIPIKKAKIMASVVILLTVDIVGVLAALSIWTASFLLLLRSRIPSVE